MMKTDHQELPLSFIESEILPRLPAKSVGSCMRVCKQLKSFLSTPTFARMHLRHITINDFKLLLDHPDHPHDVFCLASLDGLVCLASWERPTRLVFWNPLTGAYKKLSSHPSFRFSTGIHNDVVGFYKDSSNDYKLLYLINGGDFGAYVYSNRLDFWKEIEFSVEFNDPCTWSVPTWSPATFCDQCLYYVVTSRTLEWIVCFDVKTETFRKIQFPHVPRDAGEYCGSLVVLNGCLHLHVCTANGGDWFAVLDQEKSSFRKLNAEDFRRYRSLCYRSWEYGYVETLVSPNP